MQYIIISLFCEVNNTNYPAIWARDCTQNSRNWHLPTTKLEQLPSAQQLGIWHTLLGCLTFFHPHQQETEEVVFKSFTQIFVRFERSGSSSHSLMTLELCPFHQSCECFFLICWWKSLHFLTLINQQAQPLHLCLARVVGVFTSFNLSSFNSTSSWNAKSGSEPLPLADFALDNATNRVPGFFASNSYFPGWITTSRKASPMLTISWCQL